eukprot:2419441-Pleurochrysis_carterae.AAC.7
MARACTSARASAPASTPSWPKGPRGCKDHVRVQTKEMTLFRSCRRKKVTSLRHARPVPQQRDFRLRLHRCWPRAPVHCESVCVRRARVSAFVCVCVRLWKG